MQRTMTNLEDSLLPQMTVALNCDAMPLLFNRVLSDFARMNSMEKENAGVYSVECCETVHVKYKPGENCLVSYLITIRNRATEQLSEHRVTGRIYETGQMRSHYNKAMMQGFVQADVFPAVFHLDELSMLCWAFPNDRKLLQLPTLMDDPYIETTAVPELVLQRWGRNWSATDVKRSLVHYVPEHACTVRVEMTLSNDVEESSHPWVVFGKTYYNRQGKESFRHMQQLEFAAQSGATDARTARPILYQRETKVLWQEGLSGESLRGINWMNNKKLLDMAVDSLVALHKTRLKDLPQFEIALRINRLQERSAKILQAYPSLTVRLNQIVRRLCLQAITGKQSKQVTLHGDLHPQNLFAGNGQISLIDLDQLQTGPAGVDLGSWVACCLYQACLQRKPLPTALQNAMMFVDAYLTRMDGHPSWQEIAWFTSVALIEERVFRCISRLKIGRIDCIPVLVSWASQISQATLQKGEGLIMTGASS